MFSTREYSPNISEQPDGADGDSQVIYSKEEQFLIGVS